MRYTHVITFFILFFVFSFYFSSSIFADSKSDYDYQYGKYRAGYSEFTLLKQDYLATPSLDNQQKAMLSAKQTILARDLAKASLDLYLLDLIDLYRVDYDPIKPVIAALSASRQYFLNEAQKSQGIVIQDDLKKFTQDYLATVTLNDSIVKYGIVANKIATLVRIQIDSRDALANIIPKLPTPLPSGLSARLEELKRSTKVIDGKIDLLAKSMNLSEAVAESTSEIFYSAKIEKLVEIRSLQLDWINRLIDIDINYVQPKI